MWTEKVDLHCHSRHSDGVHSPKEMAKEPTIQELEFGR